jgi:hypothetical protein
VPSANVKGTLAFTFPFEFSLRKPSLSNHRLLSRLPSNPFFWFGYEKNNLPQLSECYKYMFLKENIYICAFLNFWLLMAGD